MPAAAEWAGRLGLVVASVLITLVGLELGCRLWSAGLHGLKHWPNLARQQETQFMQGLSDHYRRHPILGYIPAPNAHMDEANYDSRGYRVAPLLPPTATEGSPMLATGDSFTDGDEVRDSETWPAYLQSLVQRHTINAGVSGYGLDQIVLRTEIEAAAIRPATIVVSFIADNVWRSEMHHLWGSDKPYFVIDGTGSLILRNVPVPAPGNPNDGLTFWQRTFGWSALLGMMMHRLDGLDDWTNNSRRATPAGTGERLACPLMRRLAALGIPTLVVAQYDRSFWKLVEGNEGTTQRRISRLVLTCAAEAGLMTLDTFEAINQAVRDDGLSALYHIDHHTPKGNHLVAGMIATELARRGMLR